MVLSDHTIYSYCVHIFLLFLSESQIVVWVDPLDGTKEYTEGRLLKHANCLAYMCVKLCAMQMLLPLI